MDDKTSLKGFWEFMKTRATEIENSPNFVWRAFFIILASMILMFIAGAMLSFKYCGAQLNDRMNIILEETYEKSPCFKMSVHDYMMQNNISNISAWSEEEYNKLRNEGGNK